MILQVFCYSKIWAVEENTGLEMESLGIVP